VNASGVVTGVAAGTASITYSVTSNGCSSSTSSTVTINALPNAGTLSGTTTINTGATSTLTSNGLAGGIWSSSNNLVATVNTSGVVTGVSAGTATITYTVTTNGCVRSVSTTVTINTPVVTTLIVIRARSVSNAGANFRVEIMNSSAATGGTVLQSSSDFTNLPTVFANYTFAATGTIIPNQIRVRYFNDMSPYDFETDYITVNGTTYQTDTTTYSVGFWNAANGCNNAGFLANSLIHCDGYFHFLANSGARLGTENLETEPHIEFDVFPNPAQDVLKVRLKATIEQQVKMQIIGTNGIVIRSFFEPVKFGNNTISLPIHQLSEGTFIISAEYNNQRSTAKFSVIR
jgi:hypothetical protein